VTAAIKLWLGGETWCSFACTRHSLGGSRARQLTRRPLWCSRHYRARRYPQLLVLSLQPTTCRITRHLHYLRPSRAPYFWTVLYTLSCCIRLLSRVEGADDLDNFRVLRHGRQ
jgi:hypothetical protein